MCAENIVAPTAEKKYCQSTSVTFNPLAKQTKLARISKIWPCIDFECGLDENNDFEDVCVGWQYVNVNGSYREAGKASDMLEDVMAKTVTAEMKERKVFVFAHNM